MYKKRLSRVHRLSDSILTNSGNCKIKNQSVIGNRIDKAIDQFNFPNHLTTRRRRRRL